MRLDVILVVAAALMVSACTRKVAAPVAPNSYRAVACQLRDQNASQALSGVAVTPAFFESARTAPLVGRVFVAGDFPSGHVAVLSYRLWQRQFGGNPGIIGSSISLNAEPAVVVGVMPETFEVPPNVDLWMPDAQR